MTELKKTRIKAVMKYTWPFYILAALLVSVLLYFVFGLTHKIPEYKTLTLFVSGNVVDQKKFEGDLLEKYKDNDLKSVSCISADPKDSTYNARLTVPGYNSADVLIIPTSKLDSVNVSAFALDLSDELISSYYPNYTFYSQDDVKYGIKLDKDKVKDYFTFNDETFYLLLNGKSKNIGSYSSEQIKEHDNALTLVQAWGM